MEHLCECGCGGEVGRSKNYPHNWNRFICGHITKNKKMSQETKDKLAKAHFGKKHSKKSKQKMSESRKGENNPFYGKKMSEDHKLKLLQVNTGKIITEKTRKKLSEAGKNRSCSKETKLKISKANKGRVRSQETRNKISKTKKNKPLEDKLKLALFYMKPRTDGYCDAWSDKEYVDDLRKSACERCGITNRMCIHLFGYKLSTHHTNGKKNCAPEEIQTLCNRCHAKSDWELRKGV